MIFIAFLIIISTLLLLWYKNERNGPPGPIGIPILGYYPFLGSNPVLSIQSLSEKYGEIMKVNLLNRNFYILNSFEAINEAFVNQGENFAGRPINEFSMMDVIYEENIYCAEGKNWKIQQKFYMNKLSSLGMGKTEFGYVIHEICDELISGIKTENELNNLPMYLSNFSSNVIFTLMCGKSYEPSSPEYKELVSKIDKLMRSGPGLNFYLCGSIAEFMLKANRKNWTNFTASIKTIFDFLYERIKTRVEKLETEQFDDVLDYIIREMKGPNSELFSPNITLRNFTLLLIAGTETVSSTLNFGFNLMALYPDIQERVYEEIFDVFGKHHKIVLTEIERLNFTRAVIAEIQRFSCVVPLGLIHVNKKEAIICGYRIPKRSIVIPNIYNVSREKKYFKNPDVFDPNNFLDERGRYAPNEANIPFGIGKRKCIGYKLAEMELLIGFTRLIQEFEWLPPKEEKFKFEVNYSLSRYLSSNKIIAKMRN